MGPRGKVNIDSVTHSNSLHRNKDLGWLDF
jgi:hypothetical protein